MSCKEIVSPSIIFVASLAFAADPVPEDQLSGAWKDGDRASTIEFKKSADGSWTGTTIAATRPVEVNTVVFERLVYDAKANAFRGTLIRPEDASRHDVTLTLSTNTTAAAVVKKFIFSKTIALTKQLAAVDAGSPSATP